MAQTRAHDDDEIERIEQEIAETRRQASATMAEIEDRLDMRRLMNQGVDWLWSKENLRDTGGALARQLPRAATDNPLALLLIAAGIGLIAYNTTRRAYRATGPDIPYDENIDAPSYVMARRAGPPVEQVLPDETGRHEHHVHVSHSDPTAPAGPTPDPNTLVGEPRSGKSAADSAQTFREGEGGRTFH